MDKTTRKVLRYLSKQDNLTSQEELVAKFGDRAPNSVEYLVSIGFLKQTKNWVYANGQSHSVAGGKYEITGGGLCYLHDAPLQAADSWITRICAIVGAITGIVALIVK